MNAITPAGGGDPAGVIWDDWQLGGGVLPIVSDKRWEEECAGPNSVSGLAAAGPSRTRVQMDGRFHFFKVRSARRCLRPVPVALDHSRSDDCNIVGQIGFVQCNMSMDDMRCLHALPIRRNGHDPALFDPHLPSRRPHFKRRRANIVGQMRFDAISDPFSPPEVASRCCPSLLLTGPGIAPDGLPGPWCPLVERIAGGAPATATFPFDPRETGAIETRAREARPSRRRIDKPPRGFLNAGMVKLVDTPDLGSGAARRGSSSLSTRTSNRKAGTPARAGDMPSRRESVRVRARPRA